jgi:DNA repair exonuclease SbcCD ATPase subunit
MGNLMGQPPTTVDVNIKVEGQEKPIEIKQLPASLSIADYGNGMVISESKESILNEIGLLKSSSQKVIDSIDQHKKIVQKCDTLLQELNPQIKQEAERSREIESLSKRVGNMESSMGRIEEMLSRALNNKKGN